MRKQPANVKNCGGGYERKPPKRDRSRTFSKSYHARRGPEYHMAGRLRATRSKRLRLHRSASLRRPLALARAPMMLETSQPVIFAAGDVRSGSTKRVAAAVGEAGIVVSHIHDFFGAYA